MGSGRSVLPPSESYYDGEGREVNLWSLVPWREFSEDARGAAVRFLKPILEAGMEAMRDHAIRAGRHNREADRQDLDALLAFFAFPRAHWRMLRTTNAIERQFREVRRRTRSVGCFMNNASIERMLYGLFRYHNQRWEGKVRREFRRATRGAA